MSFASRVVPEVRERLDHRKRQRVCDVLSRRFGHAVLNPRALERVALFPERRIAYNRVARNANSTAMVLLHYLETGRLTDKHEAKSETLKLMDARRTELAAINGYHFLLIIRRPYSRVLSSFLDKFNNEVGLDRSRYISRFGHFEASAKGFADFVGWLEDGGLSLNRHWDLQTRNILIPITCFDTMIRCELWSAGLQQFAQKLGLAVTDRTLEAATLRGSDHATRSSQRLQQFYTADTMKRVARLYAEDFTALGYDPGQLL